MIQSSFFIAFENTMHKSQDHHRDLAPRLLRGFSSFFCCRLVVIAGYVSCGLAAPFLSACDRATGDAIVTPDGSGRAAIKSINASEIAATPAKDGDQSGVPTAMSLDKRSQTGLRRSKDGDQTGDPVVMPDDNQSGEPGGMPSDKRPGTAALPKDGDQSGEPGGMPGDK